MTIPLTEDKIRQSVRENYARIAETGESCGCAPTCCSGERKEINEKASVALGYSEDELQSLPDSADMGLGCGNPTAIAGLQRGETFLDLGSGGGIDCFLAARKVGPAGAVIGVDMTPQMISKARENAVKTGFTNVEFRLGEIEHIPAGDATVDIISSNCVINLSPNKPAVYRDAFRVLKPGGRLAISDMVALRDLSPEIREDMRLYSGCIAGTITVDEMRRMLQEAGFVDIKIDVKQESREFVKDWAPGTGLEDNVASAYIQAVKPMN